MCRLLFHFLSDQCRELVFDSDETFSGQRLINHLIRVTDVKSEDFCQMLCYLEPDCFSYNFQMEAGEPESHQCELNNSTYEDHTDNLKLNPAYKYCGAEVKTTCSVQLHLLTVLTYFFHLCPGLHAAEKIAIFGKNRKR